MFNTQILKTRRLILDGGTGTVLHAAGLKPGELPENWNLTHADEIAKLHRAYFDAGSDIVCTNTFGANSLKHDEKELEAIINAAVRIADSERCRAAEKYGSDKYIALDVGPLGRLMKPFGDLDFEEAVSIFSKSVRLGAAAGVDIILFETFTDLYELKAAILAAKESCDLPIFVSCAYGSDGHLLTGADVPAAVALCEGLGVDAMGVNCGFGPVMMKPVVAALNKYSSLPIFVKPNAGLPKAVDGKTVFELSPKEFANEMKEIAALGASFIGGCCGTSPEYISETVSAVSKTEYRPNDEKSLTLVSSYCRAVEIGKENVLIGALSDAADREEYEKALADRDVDFMMDLAMTQDEEGADIIGINVALKGTDEVSMMRDTVTELQSIIKLPFEISTSAPEVMEAALRVYNGKPLVCVKDCDTESLKAVAFLVKKYGGVVLGLKSKNDAEILESYGIKRKNIIIDEQSALTRM